MMVKNGTHAREFLSSGLQSRALVSDRDRQRQLRRHSEDECEWMREPAPIRPVRGQSERTPESLAKHIGATAAGSVEPLAREVKTGQFG